MTEGTPLLKYVFMGLVAASVLILMAVLIIVVRLLRRKLAGEADVRPAVDGPEFQVQAYHAVIQRLKDQEAELQRLRQAEGARAAATENVSEAVLTNLTSGVVLFNPAGIVRQANAAAKAILGYASPFGLHARDLFRGASRVRLETGEDQGSRETLLEALDRTLRQGEAFRRMEVEYATPAAESRVLGITLSPVRGAAGESLGAACLVSDLTEITNLSRQVRLRENLAALGEMSAGIAHEFKNSLATISGYAQMLAQDNEPATVREFAGKIASETGSLTRVVTDFLKFARPLELSREPVDVRATLEDCARECGVEVDLGGLPAGFTLMGDPTALRQAISNLLRNSAEASRNGSRPRVEVRGEQDARHSRLRLRDNGCGIAAEHLGKIFIPFFTTKASGTGLGLALVHRIVSEHGGSVSVESDASGTAFTLAFPLSEASRAAGPK